jgi:predicted glycoside hydrolase/deacetylase ChbG (UPF0249 family)
LFFYQHTVIKEQIRNEELVQYNLFERLIGQSPLHIDSLYVRKSHAPYSLIEELSHVVDHWNQMQQATSKVNSTTTEERTPGHTYDDDKYYIVTTEEVYRVSYVVRADSPDKAIVILNEEDMEKVYDKEYMAINHTDEWEVEEATKAEIEFAVRKNLYYS